MKTLKNAGIKILGTKILSGKGWRMLFVLALVFACLFTVTPVKSVLADQGGVKGHTFNFTFTKWATSLPQNPPSLTGVLMEGIVGGDVGNGDYAGVVLNDDLTQQPDYWIANAQYEFYGEKHSFIADVHVTQNNNTGTGVITGVITQGWLKGAQITGEYSVEAVCPIATPGNVFGTSCFQGELEVHVGLGFKQ